MQSLPDISGANPVFTCVIGQVWPEFAKFCNFTSFRGLIFEQAKINFEVKFVEWLLFAVWTLKIINIFHGPQFTLNNGVSDDSADSTAGDCMEVLSAPLGLMAESGVDCRTYNLPITSTFKRSLDHQIVISIFPTMFNNNYLEYHII